MKKTVLLVFGGRSAEHEISILSARNVAAALDPHLYDLRLVGISHQGTWHLFDPQVPASEIFDKLKSLDDTCIPAELLNFCEPCTLICKQSRAHIFGLHSVKQTLIDIAFPILHGTYGEDGSIQGLFKMMNLPFVGCGIFGSAAGMDKEVMKRLFANANIPTAAYQLLTPEDPKSFDQLKLQLGLPFFIKPASQGSSVGVHKIKSEADFKMFLSDAFKYDHKVLAEEFIQGREIECAVLGHNNAAKASVCGEVVPQHDFYSYEAKYLDANGAAIQIPAKIGEKTQSHLQDIAKKVFLIMGCEGLTRVDFFLKEDGSAIVNEINTMPGFTKISMYPKMWEASGLSYTALISELLNLGFSQFEKEMALQTEFPGA